MTDAPLRILHVEDNPSDAEMALRELRKAGFLFEARRVETRDAYLAEMADFRPDLILSDYRLPEFDGMQALLLAKEHAPDVPVIITTGSVNEETAVECMKAGAVDYVLKEQLGRLGTAVRSALERKRLGVERRRAEFALRESERRVRGILENLQDVYFQSGEDGTLVHVSASAPGTYGYGSADEMMGLPVLAFYSRPEERQQVLDELRRSGRVYNRIMTACRKDGSTFWVSLNAQYVRAEDGRVTGTEGVVRDISDRRRLEAQLHQAQKMEAVGRLAGGIAHDFNNLLTVIQGYAEMLAESLKGDVEKDESVGEIMKAAQRAAALTRQLLAFSRQQVLEMQVLDLGAVVAETEKMLHRLIGEDVVVTVVRHPDLDRVKADPGQVTQVLLNLAVNARDAMPEGGRLTIEVSNLLLEAPLEGAPEPIPPGKYVSISVADTGCGMDAETLGHIFEPFFTTKERGKGTGLGLATVYGIVRQSGGYVAVRSAPGAGTTLRTYWPQCDEPVKAVPGTSIHSLRGTETVLVVEDDPSVRSIAQVVLRKHGYTVLVAGNGHEALELLSRAPRPVQVLLADVVMPEMNGRDLASRISATHPSVKTVLMSGYAAEVLTRLEEAGVDGFLPKPFSERTLAAKIREVLDAPPAASD